MTKWGWASCAFAISLAGCSGSDLARGKPTAESSADSPQESATNNFVAGVQLAHVTLTATHTIDLWETRPGSVLMIQSWDSSQGETKLDLERQLLEAGGKYTELYRKLLNDPQAELSPELVAADEHRSHLPVRNGLLPLPAAPAPHLPPASTGSTATDSIVSTAQPGALSPQGIKYRGGGIATFVDPSWCSDSVADNGWCPEGAYNGFINGNVNETMYWNAIGHNPQPVGSPMDRMKVKQWLPDSANNWDWRQVFDYGLSPGHSVEAYSTSTGFYQGFMTGNLVSYAERWRLTFPSLTMVQTYPGYEPGWSTSGFANDIQGMAHDMFNTLLSRTEYGYNILTGVATPLYGVMGVVAYNLDMGQYAPARFAYPEPASWRAQGYTHYGEIAYAKVGTKGGLRNGVYISLSKANGTHGGIGVWAGPGTSNEGDRGTVEVSPTELAWLAINPKDGRIFASSGGSPIQAYTIHFPASGNSYPPPVLDSTTNIDLVNGPIMGGIQGGKISRHGKLWVSSLNSNGYAVVSGIDPYTGVVQMAAQYVLLVQVIVGTDRVWKNAGGYFRSLEAEGLDITDPGDTDDLVINTLRPYVEGQIHVQILGNNALTNDGWEMLNFKVSDLNRL